MYFLNKGVNMGLKAIEIIEDAGLNINELISKLQSAYADECLAFIQYWEGSKVAIGVMREALCKEMDEHTAEEQDHANLLAKRIIELGGSLPVGPQEWLKRSTCGYDAPTDSDIRTLLEQNLISERCAIETYKRLAEFVRGKDDITYKLAVKILEEEVEHEQDLETIKEDMTAGL